VKFWLMQIESERNKLSKTRCFEV